MKSPKHYKCLCYDYNRHNEWFAYVQQEETEARGYRIYDITARGTCLTMVLIHTQTKNWVGIPQYGLFLCLSYLTDIFWNREALAATMGETDGSTIACALNYLATEVLQ